MRQQIVQGIRSILFDPHEGVILHGGTILGLTCHRIHRRRCWFYFHWLNLHRFIYYQVSLIHNAKYRTKTKDVGMTSTIEKMMVPIETMRLFFSFSRQKFDPNLETLVFCAFDADAGFRISLCFTHHFKQLVQHRKSLPHSLVARTVFYVWEETYCDDTMPCNNDNIRARIIPGRNVDDSERSVFC